jgi:NitT/TauT family transport system substrate-binding protein
MAMGSLRTCLLLALALAPAGLAAQAGLTTVRLANLSVGNPVQNLGVKKGFFARHGVDLKVIPFLNGGAEATAGAFAGQVDMGSYGSPILTGLARGLPIKIVASPAVKGMNFELVARPGIGRVEDLRGKVISAGTPGNGTRQALLKILKAHGLGEQDVQLVGGGGASGDLILATGRVDAVVTTELTTIKLEGEGVGRLLARARDYYPHYQHSYVFATDAFIKAHPEAVRGFILASRESYQYARAHLDEVVAEHRLLKIQLSDEQLREYWRRQFKLWDLSFKVDEDGLRGAVEVLQELKEIKRPLQADPKTWLDRRFL